MVTKIKNNKKILYTLIGLFILVFAVLIPLGFATGIDSAVTYFDNTNSSAGGLYLKDAIDDMNYYCSKKCPKNKVCESNTPKCRRATTLHTETCDGTTSGSSNPGNWNCYKTYASGATITYGNINMDQDILKTGDAFDCDINGDGTYDSETERFYYVSDYYDTKTKSFNDNVAVLSYYSAVYEGVPLPEKSYLGSAYDCTNKNYNGPVTAIEQLPTNAQWSNIRLYEDTRQILTYQDTTEVAGKTLPTAFSYAGYAARLLTFQELYKGCSSFTNHHESSHGFLNSKCEFLFERTRFATRYGPIFLWLETVGVDGSYAVLHYRTDTRATAIGTYNQETPANSLGIRPAIDVLKSEMSY